MGSVFSRSSDPTSLKLAAQKVTEFNGNHNAFPHWKITTECAFFGTGFERILNDKQYSKKDKRKNAVVFSQLQLATSKGTAAHLVRAHMANQDGHEAWQNLLKWFEGTHLSIQSADAIRTKLNALYFNEGHSASDYINKFEMWNCDLELINNGTEGSSTSSKIQSFLSRINHPKYQVTVEVAKNVPDLTLDMAISRIRQRETELQAAAGAKRKLPGSILRRAPVYNYDEEHYPTDGYESDRYSGGSPPRTPGLVGSPSPAGRPMKRRRLDDGQPPSKLPKDIHLREAGTIHIKDIWSDLLTSDRDFVTAWNSRVRHNESTKDITIPPGVTLHPFGKAKGNILKRVRRQIHDATDQSPAMKIADGKRIHFNLHSHYQDGELEDVDPDMD